MPAYVIADIEVKDQDAFGEYRARVGGTIEKYGGRYLVRGGAHEAVEGTWKPRRLIVLEFPDLRTANAWYRSPEYAPLIAMRQKAADGSVVIVDGHVP
jgi:uncharacterized protein (DUF1330 family)